MCWCDDSDAVDGANCGGYVDGDGNGDGDGDGGTLSLASLKSQLLSGSGSPWKESANQKCRDSVSPYLIHEAVEHGVDDTSHDITRHHITSPCPDIHFSNLGHHCSNATSVHTQLYKITFNTLFQCLCGVTM